MTAISGVGTDPGTFTSPDTTPPPSSTPSSTSTPPPSSQTSQTSTSSSFNLAGSTFTSDTLGLSPGDSGDINALIALLTQALNDAFTKNKNNEALAQGAARSTQLAQLAQNLQTITVKQDENKGFAADQKAQDENIQSAQAQISSLNTDIATQQALIGSTQDQATIEAAQLQIAQDQAQIGQLQSDIEGYEAQKAQDESHISANDAAIKTAEQAISTLLAQINLHQNNNTSADSLAILVNNDVANKSFDLTTALQILKELQQNDDHTSLGAKKDEIPPQLAQVLLGLAAGLHDALLTLIDEANAPPVTNKDFFPSVTPGSSRLQLSL